MIVIVFGLPGTGKSYFSRQLARETGISYLNTDIVRKRMNKEGQYDPRTKQMVYDQLLKDMIRHVSAYENVILDGTFSKDKFRKDCMDKASELGQDVFFIEMKADDPTVRKRMKKDRKHSEADYGVYEKMKHEFEPMEAPHLVLPSDKLSNAEMIKKAKKLIYGERAYS